VTASGPPPEALFYEQGASWMWLLAGPAAGVAMGLIQLSAGYGIQLRQERFFLVFEWIEDEARRRQTKELMDAYAKENPSFTFRAGLVQGRVIDVRGIMALATLPSAVATDFASVLRALTDAAS